MNRIFTVPNQLTFLRLAFLPFFIIAIKYDRYGLALWILLAGGISDALDGLLARRLNQKTTLGAYLDPIADKLLLSSSYVVLALKGKIGWWLAILVLGRDVLILVACAVILLAAGYRSFLPPSIWGKASQPCLKYHWLFWLYRWRCGMFVLCMTRARPARTWSLRW